MSMSSNWIATKDALGWLSNVRHGQKHSSILHAVVHYNCKNLMVVALGEMKMKFTIYDFIFFQMDGG
jgi:hypothetical protein